MDTYVCVQDERGGPGLRVLPRASCPEESVLRVSESSGGGRGPEEQTDEDLQVSQHIIYLCFLVVLSDGNRDDEPLLPVCVLFSPQKVQIVFLGISILFLLSL